MKLFETSNLLSWIVAVVRAYQSEERILWLPTIVDKTLFFPERWFFISNESYASIIQVIGECEKLNECRLWCPEPGGYFSLWKTVVADPFLDGSHLGSDMKKCYTYQLRGNIVLDLPDQSYTYSEPFVLIRKPTNFKSGMHTGTLNGSFHSRASFPFLLIDFGEELLIRKVNIHPGNRFGTNVMEISVRIGKAVHNENYSRYYEIGRFTLNGPFPQNLISITLLRPYSGRYIFIHQLNSPPEFIIGHIQIYTLPYPV